MFYKITYRVLEYLLSVISSTAKCFTLSKLYDVPVGFVSPLLFRKCIAIFAVAEGWLLLDIGCFVLFLKMTQYACKHIKSMFESVMVQSPSEKNKATVSIYIYIINYMNNFRKKTRT